VIQITSKNTTATLALHPYIHDYCTYWQEWGINFIIRFECPQLVPTYETEELHLSILWNVDPLLGNNHEISVYTTATAR
jgi:hypothetical protein